MWDALPVQVPLEGRGPSEARAGYFLYTCSCRCVGEEHAEGLGPRRQAMRPFNRYQGNLNHVIAENALLKAWPIQDFFRGKQLLKSGWAESEIQEDRS